MRMPVRQFMNAKHYAVLGEFVDVSLETPRRLF